MTRSDLIRNIAKDVKVTKAVVESVLDSFEEQVKQCLIRGDKLILKNFVTFEVSTRAAHNGINLQTGEMEWYPETKSPKCKISKSIKTAVNGKCE